MSRIFGRILVVFRYRSDGYLLWEVIDILWLYVFSIIVLGYKLFKILRVL